MSMHCWCRCHVLATTAVALVGSRNGGGGVQALVSPTLRGHSSLPAAVAATAGVDFIVTLERASNPDAEDEALWDSGVFDAEVHPDLPPAWTIAELVRYSLQRAKQAVFDGSGGGREAIKRTGTPTGSRAAGVGGGTHSAASGDGGGYLVRTVPVQMSRKKELRRRLAEAAGVDSEGALVQGCRPADALLLVSGSHPGRRLPLMKHLLLDVYDELRLATSMRESGHLPAHVAFWAVANPVAEAGDEGVDRVRKKVELGAEVIITQPPLVWESFERWLRGFQVSGALAGGTNASDGEVESSRKIAEETRVPYEKRRSFSEERCPRRPSAVTAVGGGARVLVGMPVITSPKGLQFWLDLCGVGDKPRVCKLAFEAFGHSNTSTETTAARGGKLLAPALDRDKTSPSPPYGQAWFETTVSRLRSLESSGLAVSGVHVMAPGAGPRRRASDLACRGAFGAPRWRRDATAEPTAERQSNNREQ